MASFKRLIEEVHRRSLWQVLLIYVGGAWVCYEIIDTITDRLALPTWLPATALILFLIGLPFVLATAFVQEGGPLRGLADPTLIPESSDPQLASSPYRGIRGLFAWRNALFGGVIALALWGVVAAGWMLFGRAGDDGGVANGRPSLAALPFVNRSGLEKDEYFTDGIHDEILTRLAKISSLSVRGRTSVMQYRDTPKNLRQIGQELNARYILEGGVQRAGGTVRINLQLVDTESDEHVWAETYDRPLIVENLLDVQSEVALRVAEALNTALTADETERIATRPTDNLEAYEYYLHGRHYFHQRTSDGFTRAIDEFEKAIELDTAFAPAYAGLASAYGVSVTYDYSAVLDPYSAAHRALSMADAALSLAPNQAEAYAARGYVLRYLWVPFERVESDLRRAIELEPSSANAHGWYAHLLAREGRIDDAIRENEVAVDLDPLGPGRRGGFSADALSGDRYDIALREANRALALVPGIGTARAVKALSLLMLGRADECVQLDAWPYEGLRAMCLYAEGKVAQASAIIDSLTAAVLTEADPNSVYRKGIPAASIATYYAWVGNASTSLAWFERAIAISPEPGVLFRLVESRIFDNVRRDADFWIGVERLRRSLRTRVGESR
jgi:TolB-like protein